MLTRLLLALLLALTILPARADTPPVMQIYVTVDWEGMSLDDENITAMQEFRQRHPEIPMLQFLNPVYELRLGAAALEKMRDTLLPADVHGLHIHPWKSLITYCSLPYHDSPAFAEQDETCVGNACGYTVSLEYAYSQAELTQLVKCSSELLVSQGFERPTSFRAGGWQQGPKLAAALHENGFTLDSSRTDAHFLIPRWGVHSRLVEQVDRLHSGSTPLDQPYELLPGLTELPNNASLADYTSTQKIVDVFRELLQNRKSIMVLGFHQETAFNYLHRLEAAIPLLEQEAAAAGVTLEWTAAPPTLENTQ